MNTSQKALLVSHKKGLKRVRSSELKTSINCFFLPTGFKSIQLTFPVQNSVKITKQITC